jgi:YHS domain-containing protein
VALLAGLAAGVQSIRAEDMPMPKDKGDGKMEQADEKAKPYPLDKCIVSGEKLGEMGKPVVLVHAGQEMKFCCKDCVKKFNKDPEKYIKMMNEEAAKKPMDKK